MFLQRKSFVLLAVLLLLPFNNNCVFVDSFTTTSPHTTTTTTTTTSNTIQQQQQCGRRPTTWTTQQQHSSAATTTSSSLFLADSWAQPLGESALQSVQNIAARVAQSSAVQEDRKKEIERIEAYTPPLTTSTSTSSSAGGTAQDSIEKTKTTRTTTTTTTTNRPNQQQVLVALAKLEKDMSELDTIAGQKPQLSPLELTLLSLAVLAAASGPAVFAGTHITNVLAPASAAFSASIGIGAEYVGKVAVADGKEVAAQTIQCAAEAEGFLANAERSKAVTPLCVGIGATAASFALLAPVLMDALNIGSNLQLVTELYLFCPLVSVLAAAVASLALQETKSYTERAIGVGNRRFAKSGMVGRTWMSTPEQIERRSITASQRWKSFSLSVLPAPLVGVLVPGALPTKTIVVAALAAAQSAYFLAQAEFTLARATDACALKARSAAVCDTYANQGARSAAILPFTSALSSLCAAATAAIVELPFMETLATTGAGGVVSEMVLVSVFPAFAALFAAAASVSKARCEVDAEAAAQAASTLALEYSTDKDDDDPVLRPFRGVTDLIRLTTSSSLVEPFKRRSKVILQRSWFFRISNKLWNWLLVKVVGRSGSSASNNNSAEETETTVIVEQL